MSDDLEVIHRVLNGDAEAFRLIVARYEHAVIRMLRNITCDAESYQDLAQDVFFTAYRKLRTFDPARSSFSTWLFTIARNKSINALRRKRPVVMSELPETAVRNDPCEQLQQRQVLDELDRQLAALPAAQRRAFVFAEFEGLTYDEIARIESTRIGTIRSRINRAKTKLRAAMEKLCT